MSADENATQETARDDSSDCSLADEPYALTVTITADGVTQELKTQQGETLWKTVAEMQGPGALQTVEGKAPFDSPYFEDCEEEIARVGEAIDDIAFGPFDVAIALYKLRELTD